MKRIAILVIASTRQPVYLHYLKTYWTRLIRRTNAELPHLSVFLLFEHDAELDGLGHLSHNILQDPTSDYGRFCPEEHQTLTGAQLRVHGVRLWHLSAVDMNITWYMSRWG
ncbi:MAG: hypothetical protein AAF560_30285 [Acidobacteriota bacterium]